MAMDRHRPTRSNALVVTTVAIAACLAAEQAHAWVRPTYEDAQVVRRSEVIVIGHLVGDSIQFMSHPHRPDEGATHEHRATLVVSEVLKGDLKDREIPIIIHYGLTPVVGGYAKRGNFMIDRRSGRADYPKDIVEVIDTGSSVTGHSLVKDAAKDNIWFLRRRSGPYGREPGTGLYGIVDPEDLQSLSLKSYIAAYLDGDPERAIRRAMAANPEVAERSRRFLDHLEVQRATGLRDPGERARALLPYFLKGTRWDLESKAREGLLTCGAAAGPLLLPSFTDRRHAARRQDIIALWGETGWRGGVPVLTDLLKEHDGFWARQDLRPGWWNADVESALTQRRRDAYGEVHASVIALGRIGDARAREAIEATRRRWGGIGFENPQIVEACDRALEVFSGRVGR